MSVSISPVTSGGASFDWYFEVDQVAYRLIFRADGQVQDQAAYGIYQRTS